MNRLFLITAILFLPIIINSCGEQEINSSWKNNSIIIDGKQTDWQDKLHYLADNRAAIGVENDQEYLYLCLVTNDTSKIFQLFRTGFTVWIEPQNGGDKLGVQYPVNSLDPGELTPMRDESTGMRQRPDFAGRFNEIKSLQHEVRIVNDDNFPLTAYSTSDTSIVGVDIGMQEGLLVYELRVPLSQNIAGKHNFNSKPGDELKINFQSGEIDRENFKGHGFDMGNRQPGNDMEGRGSGMHPGGDRQGQRPPMFEKIDFSIIVRLAQNN